MSPEVENAALRRKERYDKVMALLKQGTIGENHTGLLELRDEKAADASVEKLLAKENGDRMLIYKALAQKNDTSVEDIQKVYAQRLQKDAPTGAPIEIFSKVDNAYVWKQKK